MKLLDKLSMLLFTAALIMLVSCEMAVPPFGPTDRPDLGGDDDTVAVVVLDTAGWNVPAEAITVAEARAICSDLESGATTGTKYYVKGFVKKLHSKHASGITDFGNAQFYIEDVSGANSFEDFLAYQVYGPNGEKLTDPNCVAIGDFVVIYGELTNYNGTYETVGKGAAHIWKSTNPLLAPAKPKPVEKTILEEVLDKDFGTMDTTNVAGEQVWNRPMIKVGKQQKKANYIEMDGKNTPNEDWLITPALDLTGMSEATLSFDMKFTSEVAKEYQKQYVVLASTTGDVSKAEDWKEMPALPYDSTSFTTVTLSVPEEMVGKKCYIAWKYTCQETSHAWQLRNVVVKAMTKVD